MPLYDVSNRISRGVWARNEKALFVIKREMQRTPGLKVTQEMVDEEVLNDLGFRKLGNNGPNQIANPKSIPK